MSDKQHPFGAQVSPEPPSPSHEEGSMPEAHPGPAGNAPSPQYPPAGYAPYGPHVPGYVPPPPNGLQGYGPPPAPNGLPPPGYGVPPYGQAIPPGYGASPAQPGAPGYGPPAPYGHQQAIPMQPYAQQPMVRQPYAQQPIQPYGQPPAYGPYPGYGPPPGYAPAPINIVVQNTASAGGMVRVANRNRATAAVLAIFFGGFGAHKFYLGQNVLGILYLCMFWSFLPAVVGFFEGVGYLTSTDQAFDMKYNARLA